MKKKTPTQPVDQVNHDRDPGEPAPIVLDDNHPYVVLQDGRIARVCQTFPIGKTMYLHIKVKGSGVTKRYSVRRVQQALGYKASE